jgi:hypothetical protein
MVLALIAFILTAGNFRHASLGTVSLLFLFPLRLTFAVSPFTGTGGWLRGLLELVLILVTILVAQRLTIIFTTGEFEFATLAIARAEGLGILQACLNFLPHLVQQPIRLVQRLLHRFCQLSLDLSKALKLRLSHLPDLAQQARHSPSRCLSCQLEGLI